MHNEDPLLTVMPLRRDEASERMERGNATLTATTIISVALYSDDREWASEIVRTHLSSDVEPVLMAAILGVAHIARIDRRIVPGAMDRLKECLNDERTRGRTLDAIDDITTFTSISRDEFGSKASRKG